MVGLSRINQDQVGFLTAKPMIGLANTDTGQQDYKTTGQRDHEPQGKDYETTDDEPGG